MYSDKLTVWFGVLQLNTTYSFFGAIFRIEGTQWSRNPIE